MSTLINPEDLDSDRTTAAQASPLQLDDEVAYQKRKRWFMVVDVIGALAGVVYGIYTDTMWLVWLSSALVVIAMTSPALRVQQFISRRITKA